MATTNLTNTPITSGTLTQLGIRRSILLKTDSRSSENLQYLNSNTGWVRVTSSVNINNSAEEAKSNVFIGGVQGREGLETYDVTKIGYRPMPGLTSFSINSDGKYGQLRKASLSFQCWSLEQLEIFEKLYMRPGFSILVEWGHTVYYDNKGNFYNSPSTLGEAMFKGNTEKQIQDKIEDLRQQTGYNYDAFFGIIQNFSWKYRSDGGYDCTLEAVSKGQVIESLTADVSTDQFTTEDSYPLEERVLDANLLQGIFNKFKKVQANQESITTVWDSVKTAFPGFAQKFYQVNGTEFINAVTKDMKAVNTVTEAPDRFMYIRMDSLCGILNALIAWDQKNGPLIRLNSKLPRPDLAAKSSKFRTYDHHTSSDPKVCLITTDSTKIWVKSGEYPSPITTMRNLLKGAEQNYDEILTIWVNVDVLIDSLTQLQQQSDKSKRTIFNFLAPVLSKISEALGGHYNELDLEYDEDTSTYYIVDRKLKVTSEVYKNCPTLELTGLNSSVVSIDLTTKIPPKLTDMIAISAQAGVTDVGLDIQNLFEWNKGLEDRVLGDKFINPDLTNKSIADQKKLRESQNQKRFGTISAILEEFYNPTKAIYDEKKFQTAKINYRDYTYTYSQLYAERSDKLEDVPAGIVPFELSITMEGISGIKKLQIFKLSQGILPRYYEGIVGFIVTGISNTIENSKWYTTIKAATINIKPSKKEAFAGNLNHRELPTTLNTTVAVPGAPLPFTMSPAGQITITGTGGNRLAEAAKQSIGTSTASIQGTDGGNRGCAAAVSIMFKRATGKDIKPGNPIVLSTEDLYNTLLYSRQWVEVSFNQIQPGDVLVTARGSRAGHTGIYAGDNRVISNSSTGFRGSTKGTIQSNYSLTSWASSIIPRNPAQSKVFRYKGI